MNIAKNMEAIFVVAIILIGGTSLASAAAPAHRFVPSSVAAPVAGKMQVVTITAKRLSAAEKASAA